MEYFELYATYVLYALVCYLPIALLLNIAMNLRARQIYNADELIRGGNLAISIRRGGAHLGLAVAMIGVASGQTNPDLIRDMLNMLAYGLLAAAFMMSSMLVTDKLILPGINNTQALRDGNMAVGLIEFGALLMTGIIAYASIQGDSGSWVLSIAYFIAGQASLVGLTLAYERIFSSHELIKRVSRGEMASGIYLSSKLIAYGLVLQAAIIGPTRGSALTAASEFLITAVGGLILLFIFEWVVDKLIVTSTDVKTIIVENQVSAAVQLALPKVGFAMFLGLAML